MRKTIQRKGIRLAYGFFRFGRMTVRGMAHCGVRGEKRLCGQLAAHNSGGGGGPATAAAGTAIPELEILSSR